MRGSELTAFAKPGDNSPLEGFMRAGNHALGLPFRRAPAEPPPRCETSAALYALALWATIPVTLLFHFFGRRRSAIKAGAKQHRGKDEPGLFGTDA